MNCCLVRRPARASERFSRVDFVQQTIMLKFVVGIIVSQRLFSLISTFLADSGVPPPLRYVVYAVIFASGMLGAMWHYQEDILYRPEVPAGMGGSIKTIDDNPSGMRSPAEHGMAFEETRLVAADGVETHAWFMPAPGDSRFAPTLLFSHENAGNMGLRLHEFKMLHSRLGCNVMMYDYRGYGNSQTAKINEEGIMRDARAAWAWLLTRPVDVTKLFLYGRSLGGAVSIQLAKELCEAAGPACRPAGVIVGNTFTSIEGLLASIYPFLNFRVCQPASKPVASGLRKALILGILHCLLTQHRIIHAIVCSLSRTICYASNGSLWSTLRPLQFRCSCSSVRRTRSSRASTRSCSGALPSTRPLQPFMRLRMACTMTRG